MPHIKGFLRFLIRTPYEGTPRGACRVKSETRMRKRTEIRTEPGQDDRKARAAEKVVRERERGRASRRTAGRFSIKAERHSPVGPQSPTVTPKILVYTDANRRLTLFAVDKMDVGESANSTYPYYSYVFISDGNSRVMGMRRGPEEAGDRLDGKGGGRRRGRGNDRKPTAEVYLKVPKAQNHRNRVLKPYNHCNVIE